MSLYSVEDAGIGCGSITTYRAPGGTPAASGPQYESQAAWLHRYWEGAETNRLNESHWYHAADESINAWLESHLSVIRGRIAYEEKNNPIILGVIGTYADDIVGADGPLLQVQSEDAAYNEALEETWRQFFYAPCHREDISGASWIKLCLRSIAKTGACLSLMQTADWAEGPVKLRLRPTSPRRLSTPAELTGNPSVFMGVQYDVTGRPIRYWIKDQVGIGTGTQPISYTPYPADMVLHLFPWMEEDQGAGVPWLAAGIQSAADLRDFDDQVQDAARQMADNSALLFTRNQDNIWTAPESTTVQRRTIRMAPPGWEPWQYNSIQPPVQYPDYRAERHLDIGRPASMPRLLVRLDASKHSWASARLDIDTYRRASINVQTWFSGSERSAGALNRLVDAVAAEARFSVPELRRRPLRVTYHWEWPELPPVEQDKQAKAEATALESKTRTLTEILSSRKKTLAAHIEELRREEEAFDQAGVTKPAWMTGQQQAAQQPEEITDQQVQEAAANV